VTPADYIARGLRPIPVWGPHEGCKCERKHPKNPQQCLGKVPREARWADRPPFAEHEFSPSDNVALAMGRQPSGDWLLGIDIDGEFDLTPHLGELPLTMTTRSGRGRHLIYRVRPEADFGNWIDLFGSRDEGLGYKPGQSGAVDLRYARGALVVAPSIHRSGARYQTSSEPIADLPAHASLAIYLRRKRLGKPPERRWHGFAEGKQP
jgi:hypothetical protein